MITEQQWYELVRRQPASLEEAIESAFWRAAGRFAAGAVLPDTWQSVAEATETFLAQKEAN